ncbi:MAG: energy-coupling factor ABC transporter ATP-binding protein [Ruminococcus sp.]|jgi:energy-coupling factor transporter ATP-binding protein EcfA2|nr:energy-coupling factor ABC transporter ATP-binding protein [Ruminococcus sp.]
MIKIENFSFKYKGNDKFALHNINLDIENGAFLGLSGVSGSGKTSLLYACCGVIPHFYKGDFYGSVTLAGKDTVETPISELSKIAAIVFEDVDSSFACTYPEDEIVFGLRNFGKSKQEAEENAAEIMSLFEISDLRGKLIRSLSGGQKRKVALAAAIAVKPQVLLLDEPSGELDPEAKIQVFELLKKLNEDGLTIIVSERNDKLLHEYAARQYILKTAEISE